MKDQLNMQIRLLKLYVFASKSHFHIMQLLGLILLDL